MPAKAFAPRRVLPSPQILLTLRVVATWHHTPVHQGNITRTVPSSQLCDLKCPADHVPKVELRQQALSSKVAGCGRPRNVHTCDSLAKLFPCKQGTRCACFLLELVIWFGPTSSVLFATRVEQRL